MSLPNLPALPPGLRGRYFRWSVLLVVLFAACFIAVNAHYLFVAELYESGDSGANSLSVIRAKHFHELFGAYSRWGFHHPGPAMFYVFAWSELLLHDLLHVVPTGYNAQVLSIMFLELGFLCGGLCVAARWVRSPVFLPLAVLLAVAHWTAVGPMRSILSCWPPFALPLMFFALSVAAASVAAGQGDDLVLLVLAGSFAVHSHVAQPLFVLPLFVVAYAGLAWACRRAAQAVAAETGAPVTAAPWRRFPRAHWFAGVVAFCFLIPMGADVATHHDNNFALILEHLRYHRSVPKPYLDSIGYFLRFGVYRPTVSSQPIYPGNTTWPGLGHYVTTHVEMALLWTLALLAPLAVFGVHLWRKPVAGELPAGPVTDRRRRRRFLLSLSGCWLLTLILTLYWGHIQDGEMYYYNAWFDYAIWFVLALLGATAAADLFETFVAGALRPRTWTLAAAGICCLGAATVFLTHLKVFRDFVYDDDVSRNISKSVREALAARPDAPRVKVLRVSGAGWPAATGVAVLLDRLGYPTQVGAEWRTVFGDDHAPDNVLDWHPWRPDGKPPFEIWYMVSKEENPAAYAKHPLPDGYALVTTEPEIDPAKDTRITFGGPQENFSSYVGSGWPAPDKDAPFIWSSEKSGLIGFPSKPVPADTSVRITFDCFPYLAGGRLSKQRFNLDLNGTDLGTLQVDARDPENVPHVDVPAALWNAHPTKLLSLAFLDAISPKEIGESLDERKMALGTRGITFHVLLPGGNPDASASLRNWPVIDAAAHAVIRFAGDGANAAGFAAGGWDFGAVPVPYVWNSDRSARLDFRPVPVAPDAAVEVTFDCFPYPAMGKRPRQRARIRLNGKEVGTFTVAADDPARPPGITIPAADWNQYDTAVLTLDFPDAMSPLDAGESADPRPLALALRSVAFRVIPAIDPATRGVIRFAGNEPNAAEFVSAGWALGPDPVPYVWSTSTEGAFEFRPVPVAPDAAVEAAFDCFSYPAMGKRPRQQARIRMNGREIGTLNVTPDTTAPSPSIKIPAAVWNEGDTAALTLDFPDAMSPRDAGESADTRPLALALRSVTFRLLPAAISTER